MHQGFAAAERERRRLGAEHPPLVLEDTGAVVQRHVAADLLDPVAGDLAAQFAQGLERHHRFGQRRRGQTATGLLHHQSGVEQAHLAAAGFRVQPQELRLQAQQLAPQRRVEATGSAARTRAEVASAPKNRSNISCTGRLSSGIPSFLLAPDQLRVGIRRCAFPRRRTQTRRSSKAEERPRRCHRGGGAFTRPELKSL
jgi:hypothetical protein